MRISSADQKANCFCASLIIDQIGGGVIASLEASEVAPRSLAFGRAGILLCYAWQFVSDTQFSQLTAGVKNAPQPIENAKPLADKVGDLKPVKELAPLPTKRLIGSDIAHAVPLTFTAGIMHWVLGSTDLQIFGSLILGSIPGILIGSYFVARIPEPALRLILAVILIVVATKFALGNYIHLSY